MTRTTIRIADRRFATFFRNRLLLALVFSRESKKTARNRKGFDRLHTLFFVAVAVSLSGYDARVISQFANYSHRDVGSNQ
jgi:hypothetical protein